MILIINKPNSKFQITTKSSQANGLSVCLGMIGNSFPDKIKIIESNDFEMALACIKNIKPKAVIFQANQYSAATINQLKVMFRGTDFFVHIHSKFPFLAQEKGYVSFIHDLNMMGIGVIFNHIDAYECFPHKLNKVLPNIYNPGFKVEREWITPLDEFHVGCHGSLRLMKNTLFQACVAIRLADQLDQHLVFHINSSRDDGESQSIMLALTQLFSQHPKHRIEHTPWLEHKEFLEYCAKNIDLGMQLSMSETFNTVAADYVHAGVPVLGSLEIDWLPERCKTSPTNMIRAMGQAEYILEGYEVTSKYASAHLEQHNNNAVDVWGKFINNYI